MMRGLEYTQTNLPVINSRCLRLAMKNRSLDNAGELAKNFRADNPFIYKSLNAFMDSFLNKGLTINANIPVTMYGLLSYISSFDGRNKNIEGYSNSGLPYATNEIVMMQMYQFQGTQTPILLHKTLDKMKGENPELCGFLELNLANSKIGEAEMDITRQSYLIIYNFLDEAGKILNLS